MITIIGLCIICITQQLAYYKQSKDWTRERKDLYDRIMSKDLQEYKDITEGVPVYAPVSNDDEDLYTKEIESNKV